MKAYLLISRHLHVLYTWFWRPKTQFPEQITDHLNNIMLLHSSLIISHIYMAAWITSCLLLIVQLIYSTDMALNIRHYYYMYMYVHVF